ncbi:NTF2- export protein 2 [Mortierella sp. GBA30]|nr:NTF2- export protein 2 [Mortierella sp. GBA30]
MADSLKSHVEVSSSGADAFVRAYYDMFDTQRTNLSALYRDSSAILWNGNAFSGIKPFTEFYNKLAGSEHVIQSYDCHPLPSTPGSIIVNVSGTVKYSNESSQRLFSQSFILSPDSATPDKRFYIWSDCLRFV